MKRILFYLLPLLLIVVSCSESSQKQNDGSLASGDQKASDDSLLKQALVFFQPLPSKAESQNNLLSTEKVKLGQMLYYDTRLSKTGKNSCNSCHNLLTYGVDNKPTSTGDAGKNGERNSPTVLNAALHGMQFWDGRAKNVEEQAGMPILNPVEMAIPDRAFLVKRLSGIKDYRQLFQDAFPGDKNAVTYDHLQAAIGAFERTLITPSKFDKYLSGDVSALASSEKEGLKTFMESGCTTCHNGAAIGGNMLQKFGLVTDYRPLTGSKINDEGRKKVTNLEADKDVFKASSLRNISKTFPYFHDGSVNDLGEAVKIMAKAQLNKTLSDEQAKSIVLFLNTLTGEVPADAMKNPLVMN